MGGWVLVAIAWPGRMLATWKVSVAAQFPTNDTYLTALVENNKRDLEDTLKLVSMIKLTLHFTQAFEVSIYDLESRQKSWYQAKIIRPLEKHDT